MKARAWRGMNAATAVSKRSSISNIISMCCAESQARWAGSTPLAQWRQAGRWPECFDRLWEALNTRHGRQDGTRQMIELLALGTSEGWDRLRAAVEQALAIGCQDVAAIRHLLMAGRLTKASVAPIDVGVLARYERPQPVLSGYDQLLTKVQA